MTYKDDKTFLERTISADEEELLVEKIESIEQNS